MSFEITPEHQEFAAAASQPITELLGSLSPDRAARLLSATTAVGGEIVRRYGVTVRAEEAAALFAVRSHVLGTGIECDLEEACNEAARRIPRVSAALAQRENPDESGPDLDGLDDMTPAARISAARNRGLIRQRGRRGAR